jgi:hypothetical protein
MSEEADIKVEIKQPEIEPETKEDDSTWMMKLGELSAKTEMQEKAFAEHKIWLEKLSLDVDDAQKQSLQLREEMALMLTELSRRLAEVEAMEIVEEMEEIAEEIPEEIPEETPQIEVVEEESHEQGRKRPPLIV